MWNWLCRCIGCKNSLEWTDLKHFPLCQLCQSCLIECPPVCPACAIPSCIGEFCSFPWRHSPHIKSYVGRYLLLGSGPKILKKWESHRGWLFDRKILTLSPTFLSKIRSLQIQAVVPISQKGESSSTDIARWMSRQLKLPFSSVLECPEHSSYTKPNRKKLSKKNLLSSEHSKSILLVAEFESDERALAQASASLALRGASSIHVLLLGIPAKTPPRPTFLRKDPIQSLLNREN